LTFEELSKMEYIHALLRETLRLWNPAALFVREVQTGGDGLKVGDYLVPDGTALIFAIHAIHHDEDLWPEPYRFDPERFLKEDVISARPSYAWIPFSAGPRACIGNKFSLLEMKITLALFLRHFEVLPDPAYTFHMRREITLRPSDLTILIRRRTVFSK